MAEENENAENTDSVEGEEKVEKKGGKKKLIIFGGLGVVLLAAAGGATFFFMSGGSSDQELAAKSNVEGDAPAEGEEAGADGEASSEGGAGEGGEQGTSQEELSKTEASAFGETYTMKTFHMNLGNPLENHYIRLDVALEYLGGEEQRAEIERRLPQLRDAIVGVVSKQTRDMILDPDGKAQLRREMLIRVNRYMKKPIEAVYITDILIE